jgi:hypothetical protein
VGLAGVVQGILVGWYELCRSRLQVVLKLPVVDDAFRCDVAELRAFPTPALITIVPTGLGQCETMAQQAASRPSNTFRLSDLGRGVQARCGGSPGGRLAFVIARGRPYAVSREEVVPTQLLASLRTRAPRYSEQRTQKVVKPTGGNKRIRCCQSALPMGGALFWPPLRKQTGGSEVTRLQFDTVKCGLIRSAITGVTVLGFKQLRSELALDQRRQ